MDQYQIAEEEMHQEISSLKSDEMKIPKCCCCDVRIGLSILFIVNLAFGILSLVANSLPSGIIWCVVAVVGFASVWVERYVKYSLILYMVGQLIILILTIVGMATVASAISDVSDPDLKKQYETTIYTTGTITLVGVVILGFLGFVYMRRFMVYLSKA